MFLFLASCVFSHYFSFASLRFIIYLAFVIDAARCGLADEGRHSRTAATERQPGGENAERGIHSHLPKQGTEGFFPFKGLKLTQPLKGLPLFLEYPLKKDSGNEVRWNCPHFVKRLSQNTHLSQTFQVKQIPASPLGCPYLQKVTRLTIFIAWLLCTVTLMSQQLQFCSASLNLDDGSQPAVPQAPHSAQCAPVIQHRDAHPPNLTGVAGEGKQPSLFRASSSPHPSNPFPLKAIIPACWM